MKNKLISKYRQILSKSNITENLHIKLSIDTLILMCANMELELLQTCHFKSTEKTTNYIIQYVINGLGVSRWKIKKLLTLKY